MESIWKQFSCNSWKENIFNLKQTHICRISILDESNNEKSTNKGHNAFIEFQEFYDTLFKKKILRYTMRGIKSKNHKLGTYETNKRSLSWFDDERYILKNGINT